MTEMSRRDWLAQMSAVSAGAAFTAGSNQSTASPPNGTIVPRTSTSDIFVPPRGRSFQKFSFDFPEPSVVFERHELSFRVFTYENAYALSASSLRTTPIERGVDVVCTEFVWAGGQQRTAARLSARLLRTASGDIECAATVEMDKP